MQVHASDQALEDVARDLGTQAKTTILVEPGIAQRVSASLPARPLEDALGVIVNDKDLVWGHVDLALPKDAPLPADSLFNMVRALSALGPARIAVRLAGSAEPVSLTHAGLPATPAGSADESRRSVYVIARRRVEAAAPASALPASEGTAGSSTSESVNRVTALSRQRYDLLQQLSPAERQQAIQQDLLYMMQLPPQARMQMLMDQRQAMQSLPPDVRQQLRQTMRDTWQQMGGGRGRRLNGGAGPAPVPMPG